MEKLTIEEKAQRFDEALKVARDNFYVISQVDDEATFAKEGIVNTFYHMFPELKDKESESEKIRKSLIGHLKGCRNNTRSEVMLSEYAKWISWLENQTDETSYDYERDTLEQEKSEDDSPYYDDICEILINLLHSKTSDVNKDAVQRDLDWLVTLKDKHTWKPSEKQIIAIRWILNHIPYDLHKEELNGLLEQLLKL